MAEKAVAAKEVSDELVLVFYEGEDSECCRVLDVRVRAGRLQVKLQRAGEAACWVSCEDGDLVYIPERRKSRLPKEPIVESRRGRRKSDTVKLAPPAHLKMVTGQSVQIVGVSAAKGFLRVTALESDGEEVVHYVMQPGDTICVGEVQQEVSAAPEVSPFIKQTPSQKTPTTRSVHLGEQIRAQIAANLSQAKPEPDFHSKPFERGYEIWKYDLPRLREAAEADSSWRDIFYFPGWPKVILYMVLLLPVFASAIVVWKSYRFYNPAINMTSERYGTQDYWMLENDYRISDGVPVGRRGKRPDLDDGTTTESLVPAGMDGTMEQRGSSAGRTDPGGQPQETTTPL